MIGFNHSKLENLRLLRDIFNSINPFSLPIDDELNILTDMFYGDVI